MKKRFFNSEKRLATSDLRLGPNHQSLIANRQSGFTQPQGSGAGFTLIELLVVVFISVTLTGIVTFNFSQQRAQQEIQAEASDLVSRIRSLQTNILAGLEVATGVVPSSYEIVFTQGSGSYQVNYVDSSGTVALEAVTMTQNVQVSQLTGGSTLRITSPFGRVLVDEVANRSLQITLSHTSVSKLRTITIDGISGRISAQ